VTPVATAAATLCSLAVLVAGCGWQSAVGTMGDDGPRLSRAAFVSRAEAACARRTRAIAALPRPRAEDDRKPFFAAVAALERTEAAALAALRPPRRDEPEFARLVSASVNLAAISERFVVALARDDAHARRRALADAERATAAYDRAAKRLKLACRQSV
jgi:hypothetical protein